MDDTSYSAAPRHTPDVPEDIDFLLEHLNDPNLDLKESYAVRSFKEKPSKSLYDRSEVDTESRYYESDRYSTSRSDSADIDFEESVSPFLSPPPLTPHTFLASPLTPRFAPPSALSTIRSCLPTLFECRLPPYLCRARDLTHLEPEGGSSASSSSSSSLA